MGRKILGTIVMVAVPLVLSIVAKSAGIGFFFTVVYTLVALRLELTFSDQKAGFLMAAGAAAPTCAGSALIALAQNHL